MTFTDAELTLLKEQEQRLAVAQTNEQISKVASAQQAIAVQEQEKSMIKDQLDLSDEYEDLIYLLKGYTLQLDDKGNQIWIKPANQDLIILTDFGINLIINFLLFYVNKNLLLSNYSEEVINQKMEDLASTLNDRIFMNYNKVFRYPTFEECKKVLLERIESKAELRKFASELAGIKREKEEIKKEFVEEMETTIEKEIGKIKEQLMKEKLTAFESIIRVIQDFIHSAYNRAYRGEERKTLRQHIHISEMRGQQPAVKNPKKLNLLDNY